MNAATKELITTVDNALDLPVVKKCLIRLIIGAAFAAGGNHAAHADSGLTTVQYGSVATQQGVTPAISPSRVSGWYDECDGDEQCIHTNQQLRLARELEIAKLPRPDVPAIDRHIVSPVLDANGTLTYWVYSIDGIPCEASIARRANPAALKCMDSK